MSAAHRAENAVSSPAGTATGTRIIVNTGGLVQVNTATTITGNSFRFTIGAKWFVD